MDASDNRLRSEFQRLGMSPGKSECYANRIQGRLEPGQLSDVMAFVEAAQGREDMKESVLGADPSITTAFTAAYFGCGLVS